MSHDKVQHWVLVTGAAYDLTKDETEAARNVGTMLAREGYGLIVGDWPGVDQLVASSFLEALPDSEQHARIKHVDNFTDKNPKRVVAAEVLANDNDDAPYSTSAVRVADAGIVVSGRAGSKPAMDALLRLGKPVLPVAFLGWDGFELFRDVLLSWSERPVVGLTDRQFLELARPWRFNSRPLARLLRASLRKVPDIFISYRRDDVPAAAGRVFDELSHTYGNRAVFIDYANLHVGEPIERLIEKIVASTLLVAIVGPRWNAERLNQPEDYVRRELETAHRSDVQILPMLVQTATVPTAAELPESLRFLPSLNFSIVRLDDWVGSMDRVRRAVDEAVLASEPR